MSAQASQQAQELQRIAGESKLRIEDADSRAAAAQKKMEVSASEHDCYRNADPMCVRMFIGGIGRVCVLDAQLSGTYAAKETTGSGFQSAITYVCTWTSVRCTYSVWSGRTQVWLRKGVPL